jgi:prevent-host-death family protein
MQTVSVYEAKTKLSRLIAAAEDGEEIVICRGKVPVARLVGLKRKKGRRQLGSARVEFEIADDFDAPLEDFADYQ